MRRSLLLACALMIGLWGCGSEETTPDRATDDPAGASAPYDPAYPSNPVLSTQIDECSVSGGCHFTSTTWVWIRFEKYLNRESQYNPKYNFDKITLLEYTGLETTVTVVITDTDFGSWLGGECDMLLIKAPFKADTKYRLVVGDGVLGLMGEFGGVKYNTWTNLP